MANDKRPAPQSKSPASKTTDAKHVTGIHKSATPPSFKAPKISNPQPMKTVQDSATSPSFSTPKPTNPKK
ncbi:hypothetical protein CACET_c31620 [Clostridium aceticum]|uniref:Uncharacterized protein n=1 Tax=Clostridium aceticum TaxID=84022 RepID=A0A0D8IA33_9CLOT|nr:hypothetical protein [Clostridium aceticum]AKL96606.1 hypothetical protein CACET_c31620 [Clostridium aceticum]KJF26086.1 hypothetical protein TZ02_15315 [Clostridium aceticum]